MALKRCEHLSGEIAHQKWMNFYTKVLACLVAAGGIKIRVSLEVSPNDGLTERQVDETKAALREIGADGEVKEIK